jgi:maltose alpha-D-glucosyltransferase/alpha-amylase
MQWDKTPNAGFSTCPADRLYLPIDPDPNYPNVAEELANPNSQYHFVKTLLSLRRDYPALGTRGSWELLSPVNQAYPMIYLRKLGDEKVIVVLNPSNKAFTSRIPACASKTIEYLYGNKKTVRWKNGKTSDEIKVSPVSLAIIKL